jgi:hypothetical protein
MSRSLRPYDIVLDAWLAEVETIRRQLENESPGAQQRKGWARALQRWARCATAATPTT